MQISNALHSYNQVDVTTVNSSTSCSRIIHVRTDEVAATALSKPRETFSLEYLPVDEDSESSEEEYPVKQPQLFPQPHVNTKMERAQLIQKYQNLFAKFSSTIRNLNQFFQSKESISVEQSSFPALIALIKAALSENPAAYWEMISPILTLAVERGNLLTLMILLGQTDETRIYRAHMPPGCESILTRVFYRCIETIIYVNVTMSSFPRYSPKRKGAEWSNKVIKLLKESGASPEWIDKNQLTGPERQILFLSYLPEAQSHFWNSPFSIGAIDMASRAPSQKDYVENRFAIVYTLLKYAPANLSDLKTAFQVMYVCCTKLLMTPPQPLSSLRMKQFIWKEITQYYGKSNAKVPAHRFKNLIRSIFSDLIKEFVKGFPFNPIVNQKTRPSSPCLEELKRRLNLCQNHCQTSLRLLDALKQIPILEAQHRQKMLEMLNPQDPQKMQRIDNILAEAGSRIHEKQLMELIPCLLNNVLKQELESVNPVNIVLGYLTKPLALCDYSY